MSNGLEALAEMRYPGRFIILGSSEDYSLVAAYGITGRSPSSQARRLVYNEEEGRISVEVTDQKVLEQGNPDLLVYDALRFSDGNSLVVSNGKQTDDVYDFLDNPIGFRAHPLSILRAGLSDWGYEPDSPNFTPRISGISLNESVLPTGSLAVIKKDPLEEEASLRNYFHFKLNRGHGKLVTTYTGENRNPLPSFNGEPLDVGIEHDRAEGFARAIYDALAPPQGEDDFRVSVAVVYAEESKRQVSIVNRADL